MKTDFSLGLSTGSTYGRHSARAGVLYSALALLAACSSGGESLDISGGDADYRAAIEAYSSPAADTSALDPVAAAAFWSVRYDQNPGDWNAAVKYSAALRKIGSLEQSVNVMSGVTARHGDQPAVAVEMGKALIESGRAFEAVRYLEQAVAAQPRDWRTLSAYGVALDQIGEHDRARTNYEIALSENPNAAHILNNKGLSLAMSGDLEDAVLVLRAAVNAPGADARVRQNLALALAIKGDLQEAERLARSDLPPQIADQNIDYLRSLVAQPAYWQDYAGNTTDTPDFGDEEITAPTALLEPALKPSAAPTAAAPLESALAPLEPVIAETPETLTPPTPIATPNPDAVIRADETPTPVVAPAPTALRSDDTRTIEDILADALPAENAEAATMTVEPDEDLGAPLKE